MSNRLSPDGNVYPESIPNNSWHIHLEDEILHADSIQPPVPSPARGESEDFVFQFYTNIYAGQDPPSYPTHIERYEKLLRLNEHAGSYVEHTTASNRVTFLEQTPSDSTSLLVKLEPTYSTTARGLWGLLDGVADSTTDEDAVVALDMSVMKLADADEYDSRTDLRSDLENGGP